MLTSTTPRIGTVYFRVPRTQFDDLARFFGEQLGLPVKFRDGTEWLAFDGGGVTLALEGGDGLEPEGPFLALRVEDAASAHEAIARHDLPATEVRTGAHERRFTVRAPWGAQVDVYQPGTGE